MLTLHVRDTTESPKDLAELVAQLNSEGGSLVEYDWVASACVISISAPTVVWLAPGRSRLSGGLRYSVVSGVLGWWSPIGCFVAVAALLKNLMGGVCVTGLFIDSTEGSRALGCGRNSRGA